MVGPYEKSKNWSRIAILAPIMMHRLGMCEKQELDQFQNSAPIHKHCCW